MASGTRKNVAFIATIAVMIPIVIAAWFAAPIFLPMFRWVHVDLPGLARQYGIPEKTLATEFKFRVRYNPRGETDPMPWQIIDSDPTYNSVYPGPDNDERQLLVRCTLLCGNDGKPPSTAFINTTFRDRYYKAVGIRLPPGSLPGTNAKRPVVVYNGLDWNRMTVTDADTTQREVNTWETDDLWKDRDDGYEPPATK